MTHTSGPLTVKLAEDATGDYAIIDAGGEVIGEAFYQIDFNTFKPAQANAILWATSPALLEALEALIEESYGAFGWLQGLELSSRARTYKTQKLGQAIEQARAAIAKVRGE